MACFACNCYPKMFGWFLLFNGSIDVPQQTTSKYANQHLKVPKRQRSNSETTSQVHPSVSHSDFRMFVSNPNFPFFWGGWIISWDLFFKKKTHNHKHKNSLHSKDLPKHFSQTKRRIPGFPKISLFSLGEKGGCQGAKYSKNSSAKKTLLGNSAIMFTWATTTTRAVKNKLVNIEKKYIPAFCMYVYIYVNILLLIHVIIWYHIHMLWISIVHATVHVDMSRWRL